MYGGTSFMSSSPESPAGSGTRDSGRFAPRLSGSPGDGGDRLRARQTELVNDLWDRATDAGLEVKTPPGPDERAGIVMVRRDDPGADGKALAQEGIVVA